MIDKHLAELRVQVKTLKDDLCTPTISMRDQMNKIRFEMVELQIDLVDKAINRKIAELLKGEGGWGPKLQPNGWGPKPSPQDNFTLKLKHPQKENKKLQLPKPKDPPQKEKEVLPEQLKEEPKKS